MNTNHFALHQGKIVYVPDVPEKPKFVDTCEYIENCLNDKAINEYKKALQFSIANGIEVENQAVILNALMKNGGRERNLYHNQLYPLQCRVEKDIKYIPIGRGLHYKIEGDDTLRQADLVSGGIGYMAKVVARVTFEQPEKKRVCNHDALIDTGVGYDVCPMCNSSFPHNEPEAAGQEQESLSREELDALKSVGIIAENWYAVSYNENTMPYALFQNEEYAKAYRDKFSATSVITPWPMVIKDYRGKLTHKP